MVHIGRLITDIIVFGGVLSIFFKVIDISEIGFLNNTNLPFNISINPIIFIVGLAVFFVVDFMYLGPAPLVNSLLVLVLSTLALSNFGLGIMFGLLTFILLNTIGKIIRSI